MNGFNVTDLFKASFEDCKNNPVLLVPLLIAMGILLVLGLILGGGALLGMGAMGMGGDVSPGIVGGLMGLAMVMMLLAVIVDFLAFGMTVGMAQEVVESGTTRFQTGMETLKTHGGALVLAAVLVGIILSVGFMLLFLPGLVAMFFLMFTFPAIVVDGVGGAEALGRSFGVVKERIGDALMVFLGLIAVLAVVFVVNLILGIIPLLGQLLSLALGVAAGAYLAVVLTRSYRALRQTA